MLRSASYRSTPRAEGIRAPGQVHAIIAAYEVGRETISDQRGYIVFPQPSGIGPQSSGGGRRGESAWLCSGSLSENLGEPFGELTGVTPVATVVTWELCD